MGIINGIALMTIMVLTIMVLLLFTIEKIIIYIIFITKCTVTMVGRVKLIKNMT